MAVIAPSSGFAVDFSVQSGFSDVELFCPSVYWQNSTQGRPVSVAASGNWIYLSSDNGIFLSFSPLHWIRDPTNGWDSPMKRSQKIKLDRVVLSIKISQTATTSKRQNGIYPSRKSHARILFHWIRYFLGGRETFKVGLNLGQHSGSCPAVTKKFFPLFSATLTLNSKRFSAQEGGKEEWKISPESLQKWKVLAAFPALVME